MNKSHVRLILKQGVSKGSSIGWEMEVCAEDGVSEETLRDLADKAANVASYVIKKPVISGQTNARPM